MIYEDVFRKFQQHNIRYLVAGGVAVNLHGILRATADLDLMLHLEDRETVKKFVSILKELGLKPRVPVSLEDFSDPAKRESWIKEKGAVVMTFLKPDSYEQIDVFLQNPFEFGPAFERRKKVIVRDLVINVCSIEDLKTMKRSAGRAKDLSDIKQLEKIEDIDHGTA